MYLGAVDEIHLTTVHTNGSGDVIFPEWNRNEWVEEVIETQQGEGDEFSTTYSVWRKP
jgi:dihydrofolate reductase